MRYIIRAVTPIASIPMLVSIDDAKSFMRVDTAAQDDVIGAQIRASMEAIERHTGMVLTPRELEMVTAAFPVLPELICLPRDPVTGIVSIKYTDPTSGDEVEMDSSVWRWADTSPDQILPAFRQAWPVAACESGSVRIRFNAGYDIGLCPFDLVEAVKQNTLALYDGRGAGGGLCVGAMELCRPYRSLLA